MNDSTISSWIFDLDGMTPQIASQHGTMSRMNADNFAILKGMAGSLLRLKKRRYTSSSLACEFG